MARAREMQVFRITPEVGKCYEHIEATRSEYIGSGNHKHYSTNKPNYVGKYVRQERYGSGDGQDVIGIFDDNGKENRVNYSYEGYTCFNEVPCKETATGFFSGGYRKRKNTKRKNRKLKSKSKKSRK
jgi:hypothetical protein